MRIALLCGTQRGLRVLKRLKELAPDAELLVFSFKEEPWEPLFRDSIAAEAQKDRGGMYFDWNGNNKFAADLILAVNFRFIVPPAIFQSAPLGAFVFHDSLLPKYRGFSPTVWAMINGETHTGVTLFKMEEGPDEGDIVAAQEVPIGPTETIAEVTERVTGVYLELLEDNLQNLLSGGPDYSWQVNSEATYCCKRLPSDNQINWADSTRNILNLIRAVTNPYPGARTSCAGKPVIVWSARQYEKTYCGRIPGRVVENTIYGPAVLTGDGCVILTSLDCPVPTSLSTILGT